MKGQPTLNFNTIWQYYKNDGLFYDVLGVIPFNLIIGNLQPPGTAGIAIFRAVLRTVRILSAWRALQLFAAAEVSFRNNKFNIIMQILKALFYIYFLGHFLACTWYFTVAMTHLNHGQQASATWITHNALEGKPTSVQYLRSIYTVFNVVCSVGYGDMFPMTDVERCFFIFMITMGDLLFALAFGLITKITLQMSLANETQQFKDKMIQIQEFMSSFNLDAAQQSRVENYFAY